MVEFFKMLTKDKTFKLLTGSAIPIVGFGTWEIHGFQATSSILNYALEAGYRLFDTAAMYGNEEELGKAFKELLPKHNLKREDIFITTKLYPSDHGTKAYKAIENSLKKLDSGYIDLYLIHWPGVYGVSPSSKDNAKLRDQSWQEMVKAVKNGLIRHLGVSNYNVRHLTELLVNNRGIKPVVNQVEWHPYCHQSDILELCKKEGILLQAYMPLGGSDNKSLLHDVEVNRVAKKLGKSNAQVLLKWSVQQNVGVIPKSKSRDHIFSNMELDFSIPDNDMEKLSSLEQTKFDWDPNTIM